MKKKNQFSIRKLSLSKKTISYLGDKHIANINGGSDTATTGSDTYTDGTVHGPCATQTCYSNYTCLEATCGCPPSPTSAQATCGNGTTYDYTVGACSNGSCLSCNGCGWTSTCSSMCGPC